MITFKQVKDYIVKSPYHAVITGSLVLLSYLVFASPLGTLCVIAMHQHLNYKKATDDKSPISYASSAVAFINIALYALSYFNQYALIASGVSLICSSLYYGYLSKNLHTPQYAAFNHMDTVLAAFVCLTQLPYACMLPILTHLFVSDLSINSAATVVSLYVYFFNHQDKAWSAATSLWAMPSVSSSVVSGVSSAASFVSKYMPTMLQYKTKLDTAVQDRYNNQNIADAGTKKTT